jgi:hypothetical protein
MAQVINTVGSLTTLKTELHKRGINEFHSIKEIDEFERTYAHNRATAVKDLTQKLELELESLPSQITALESLISKKRNEAIEEVDHRIKRDKQKIGEIDAKRETTFLRYCFSPLIASFLRGKVNLTEYGRDDLVRRSVRVEVSKRDQLQKRLADLKDNFNATLRREADEKLQRLKHVKLSLDEVRPFILGAIGESKVAFVLSSLPDEYVVIHDVSTELLEPISLPSEHDTIHSFQIDHVVVGPTGVFVIETKHWGENTINNPEVFSPIKQVRRSGYALYRMINQAVKDGVIYFEGGWGDRRISVRNILVLTASSVKDEYQHVKVVDLNSLNGYVKWFDEEFTPSDIKEIVNYIQHWMW